MSTLVDRIYSNLPIVAQNILMSLYGYRITRERYGGAFRRFAEFLEKSQYFSQAEMLEFQRENLKKLIKHSYANVPYYRDLFEKNKLVPNDIKDLADLCKIPILTKEGIKVNFRRMIAKNVKPSKLKIGHTSGTTGSPLEILWDRRLVLMTNAVLWRQRNWAGLNFGDRFATFFGRVVVPLNQKKPPFWRYNFAHKQLLFSSFHLTRENLKAYFDRLSEFAPVCIEGYPSNIFLLAKYLQGINQRFPVHSILTTSETLYSHQRELIEDRFCCKIFDYYGMAERVVFSTECEDHKGHHLNNEYGITEFLKSDVSAAQGQQFGRIVATGLHNYAMPLIRYATNDVSALESSQCTCGRTLPLLRDITTKAEDIITTKDGRYISPSALTHPFKPLNSIRESQIIQEDVDHMLIKIVRKDGYDDSDTQRLLSEMKARVGDDMHIEVTFVDEIEREKSGKFRWVISHVPLEL